SEAFGRRPSVRLHASTTGRHPKPFTISRGFLLRRLSDAGPRCACTLQRQAGIRNPSRFPAGSFFGGFRTPALGAPARFNDRPASETLHDSRRSLGQKQCLPISPATPIASPSRT